MNFLLKQSIQVTIPEILEGKSKWNENSWREISKTSGIPHKIVLFFWKVREKPAN